MPPTVAWFFVAVISTGSAIEKSRNREPSRTTSSAMTFQQRHYAQLVLLEKLADDADPTHRRIARKLRAGLLIAMGLTCLMVVAWLVYTAAAAFYPISLGAIAGAILAGGVIELLCIGNDDEPSSWSSDPA